MQPGFGWKQEVQGKESREPGVCEGAGRPGMLAEELRRHKICQDGESNVREKNYVNSG